MRNKILNLPTARQSQVAQSAIEANIDDDQPNDHRAAISETTTTSDNTTNQYDTKQFVHYTHEKRFHSLKRDMHQVYENIFSGTPAMTAKIIVGNRNRRDAQNELIRKRPPKRLLQNTRPYSELSSNRK